MLYIFIGDAGHALCNGKLSLGCWTLKTNPWFFLRDSPFKRPQHPPPSPPLCDRDQIDRLGGDSAGGERLSADGKHCIWWRQTLQLYFSFMTANTAVMWFGGGGESDALCLSKRKSMRVQLPERNLTDPFHLYRSQQASYVIRVLVHPA